MNSCLGFDVVLGRERATILFFSVLEEIPGKLSFTAYIKSILSFTGTMGPGKQSLAEMSYQH